MKRGKLTQKRRVRKEGGIKEKKGGTRRRIEAKGRKRRGKRERRNKRRRETKGGEMKLRERKEE